MNMKNSILSTLSIPELDNNNINNINKINPKSESKTNDINPSSFLLINNIANELHNVYNDLDLKKLFLENMKKVNDKYIMIDFIKNRENSNLIQTTMDLFNCFLVTA